jgi:hypothetical protein
MSRRSGTWLRLASDSHRSAAGCAARRGRISPLTRLANDIDDAPTGELLSALGDEQPGQAALANGEIALEGAELVAGDGLSAVLRNPLSASPTGALGDPGRVGHGGDARKAVPESSLLRRRQPVGCPSGMHAVADMHAERVLRHPQSGGDRIGTSVRAAP